jgi:hypothetical protein
MRYILCALAIVLAGLPAPVFAADAPTNDQLRKRLQDLDRRIDRLERRERSETQSERADAKAAAAAPVRKEPTRADWAKVKYGMSDKQVKAILGEPLRTRSDRNFQIWSFHDISKRGGEVWFTDWEVQRIIPPQ